MSERKAFDVGYRLAVRHVIEQLEQRIIGGMPLDKLAQDLREFYRDDLEKESMTSSSTAHVQ